MMWVVVEREVPASPIYLTLQLAESSCVYDLCQVGPEGIALRVGSFTDKAAAVRVTELLNRHGMVDVPLPEGLA